MSLLGEIRPLRNQLWHARPAGVVAVDVLLIITGIVADLVGDGEGGPGAPAAPGKALCHFL